MVLKGVEYPMYKIGIENAILEEAGMSIYFLSNIFILKKREREYRK